MPTQTERLTPMEAHETEVSGGARISPAISHTRRRPGVWNDRRVRRAAAVLTTLAALLGTCVTAVAIAVARSRAHERRTGTTPNTRNWTLVVSLPFSGIVVTPTTPRARLLRRGRSRPPVRTLPTFPRRRSR